MKRHPSLIPLSREHHEVLILAQLLKPNAPHYKGLPHTMEGKKEYALALFQKSIKPHFEKEEAVLKRTAGYHETIAALGEAISNEHRQLTALFQQLQNGTATETVLQQTGLLLESHIRKEERELFPAIQQFCPETVLMELNSIHP
jgi:iron-sulfur cluster repair protein YtfE (RIC family)